MRHIFSISLLLLLGISIKAQNNEPDSLKKILASAKYDSVEVNLLNELSVYYKRINWDSSLHYAQKANELSNKINYKTGQISSLLNIGNYYLQLGSSSLALEYYLKSLAYLNEELLNYELGTLYNNIGSAYLKNDNVNEALNFYKKSLQIFTEIRDTLSIGKLSLNIGNIQFQKKNYEEALKYTELSISFYKRANYVSGLLSAYINLSAIYNAIEDYAKAETYLAEAEKIAKLFNSDYLYAVIAANKGSAEFGSKNYEQAEKDFLFSADIARKLGALDLLKESTEKLSLLYETIGKFDKAFLYHKEFKKIADSLSNESTVKKMTELELRFEFDKKDKEQKLENEKLALLNKQKQNRLLFWLITISGMFFSTVIIVFQIYKSRQKIKEINKQLVDANEEINHQKEQLSISHQQITDSINYAQKIQIAAIPPVSKLNDYGLDYFLFYQPRDVVSGDFYWIRKIREYIVIVVADCTGHGVPGAFMSMLGLSLLNEIAGKDEINHPSQAMEQLRAKVKNALNQHQNQERRDGMDMSMIVHNTKLNSWEFCGANNTAFLVNNGKLRTFDFTPNPIGTYVNEKPFKDVSFVPEKGDILYLFTDGYKHQIGGQNNKTFKVNQFKSLLESIADKPLKEQKEVLETQFYNWQNSNQQTDDVLVMGIRF